MMLVPQGATIMEFIRNLNVWKVCYVFTCNCVLNNEQNSPAYFEFPKN